MVCDWWISIRFEYVRFSRELQSSLVFEKRAKFYRSVPCRSGGFVL